MPRGRDPKISDAHFIKLFNEIGPSRLAVRLNQTKRGIYTRRQRLEARHKITIATQRPDLPRPVQYPHRVTLDVKDGYVIVGSDAHIWPGPMTPAMRGFIHLIRELRPKVVILNGDVMDFARISKHDPLNWDRAPEVQEEIEATQEILHDIATASGRARKIWTLGNHDARFEKTLAIRAPEYAKVHGVSLKNHFPLWEPGWSVWINPETDPVVIKHRFRGGDHAPWNNILRAGTHMVTAHLHSAKVIPYTDYNGTRYGVDDGCLADPMHKAFIDYTEDNPKNWRSGFCVLRFVGGKLLQPQIALVHDEKHMDFCGELHGI